MLIDVRVIQKPIQVEYECPSCEHEIEVEFREFSAEVGEVCDWKYSKIPCPECGKELEIDAVDWD